MSIKEAPKITSNSHSLLLIKSCIQTPVVISSENGEGRQRQFAAIGRYRVSDLYSPPQYLLERTAPRLCSSSFRRHPATVQFPADLVLLLVVRSSKGRPPATQLGGSKSESLIPPPVSSASSR
ncbi:hypothetical protein PS1_031446 [Malus domestica]